MITPEQAIILALNEPRIYSKLFDEAVKYRKESGQTLSRETYDKALKELVLDEFVIKKDVDGRSKQYSLNPEFTKEQIHRIFFDVSKYNKEKIEWFGKILSKMDLDNPKLSSRKKRQYEIIFSQVFLLCLEYQKRLFLLEYMPIPNTSSEKTLREEQSRLGKFLFMTPQFLTKISPNSFESVFSAVTQITGLDVTELEKKLEDNVKRFL